MRHKKVAKRQVDPDKIYKNVLVAKLINRLMRDGKKTIAEKLVYDTFEEFKKKGLDPIETFEKALNTVAPKVEIKERRDSFVIRWILEAAKARSNKDYHSFNLNLAS